MIRRLGNRWGSLARGIGDDAAVITNLEGGALVVSTDTSVEGVHFRREWLTPGEIGYRAAAAALSDLAAMGAKPIGILAALTIPDTWLGNIDAIADGIGDAARAASAPIIGGDLSRGAELSLTFTVLGTARKPLTRGGARDGDSVYLTGEIGGSGAALLALQGGRKPDPSHRERFAHPVPRIREAMWLAEHGATSAIDISDGLGSDLGHIAAASDVRISVTLDALPTASGISPLDAARSGEEYEIAVTASPDLDTAAFRQEFGVQLTKIGMVERGRAQVSFSTAGEQVQVPPGYLHFTR